MSEQTTGLRPQHTGIPTDSPHLTTLVEDLLGADRAGAVILGGPGTGKSSLVQAALEIAGLADDVHTVQCTPSLREIVHKLWHKVYGRCRRTILPGPCSCSGR